MLDLRDPLPAIGFGVRMGHRGEPTCDLPITGQRDQSDKIAAAQRPHPKPGGFDHDAVLFASPVVVTGF
jgi:hypothetical protein